MMRTSLFLTLAAVAQLLLVSCLNDADRDNPLDPKSGQFENVGTLRGQVYSYYSPFSPIGGVEIRIAPENRVRTTGSDGIFDFGEIPAGTYEIFASKPGFAPDSAIAEIRLKETSQIELHLDGLPVVQNFSLLSRHVSRWFPVAPLYLLEIEAAISDPDGPGDIERVLLNIPDFGILDTLAATQTVGQFSKTYRAEDLPQQNIQNLIGRDAHIIASDRAGLPVISQPGRLVRIVDTVPLAESPIGLTTIDERRPQLTWRAASVPFNFSYAIELFRNDAGITSAAWSRGSIAASDTSVAVATTLTSGIYFWTVSVVDEFGNSSRSKEAAFQVR